MIRYPIAGDDNSIWLKVKESGTAYPVSNKYLWHNGVHVKGTLPVTAMADGKIVAMRLASEYNTLDLEEELTLEKLKYYTGSSWGTLENRITTFFDEKGEGSDKTYSIKSDLPQELQDELLRLLGMHYSTSFILLQHTVPNRQKHVVNFYSLYMHLKPLNHIPFELLLKHPWYRVEGTINSTYYYGVRAYGDPWCQKKGMVIPAETMITLPDNGNPKMIQCVLDGVKYTSYVKDTKIYRSVNGNYEIKRPTNLEKDDGNRYCDPSCFEKVEGALLYTTADKTTRTVSGTLRKGDSFLIVNHGDILNGIDSEKGVLVNVMNKGNITKSGYIFLTYPHSVIKKYECITHDCEKENKKLIAFRDENSVNATCNAYGIDFSIRTKQVIKYDAVCSPEENEVKCGEELGFPGLFKSQQEVCHIEVFSSDVGFMDKDKKIEDPCDYLVAKETDRYEGRPTTAKEAANMPETLKTITSDYTLKIKENGKTYRYVSGEEYVAIDAVYKKVHQGKWCRHTDMYPWDTKGTDSWYLQKGAAEKKIRIATNPEDLNDGMEITIYPDIGYVNDGNAKGSATISAKNGRPVEKDCRVRRIITFYEKMSNVPNPLYVSKKVLDRKTRMKEKLSDVCDVTAELTGDELLSGISLEPARLNGKHKVGTIFSGSGEKVETYASSTDTQSIATWIKVVEPDDEMNVQWLNVKDIGGKGAVIEKLLYNDWHNFFKKRDTVEDSFTVSSLDSLITDDAELVKPFNENIKNNENFQTFGSVINNNTRASAYLSQVVYKRPSEWKKDDALTKELYKDNLLLKPCIEKMRAEVCFWDDAKTTAQNVKSVSFPKSEKNWYFHPVRFIEHLQKVELREFNPYEGQEIPAFKKEDGDVPGNHKEDKPACTVKSNPGFAPLANGQTIYTHDDNSYAICTSPYGILRYNASAKNNRLAHSGIDLAPYGGARTNIISFIYGEVWAYTHRNTVYGNVMIIKSRTEDKLYLLAHLTQPLVEVGSFVSPGIPVAICGNTGPAGMGVHLHLEVRKCSEKYPDDVLDPNENKAPGVGNGLTWNEDNYDKRIGPRTMDPFNH